VFDGQLQQERAGWEQQLLEAQYSHEALNSARERAEQQLKEVKAACQHWQEQCERLLASQDSMSKQHSQLEEVLASTTTQLCEAQQQLQQLQAFQLQYETISEATRAAKRHQSQAGYWQEKAQQGKQRAAALDQQVKELKGMLNAICKVCFCRGGIWGVWEGGWLAGCHVG
jgi:chromosome segregation ATPase